MLTALRDRQSALAVAILFLIAAFHASITHRTIPPSLSEVAANLGALGASSQSLCITGDPVPHAGQWGGCDACRLVTAPGLPENAAPMLVHAAVTNVLAVCAQGMVVRAVARSGVRLPRAPPVLHT